MFFGWLRGQTTDSSIFFDMGAYSDTVAVLFEKHIKTMDVFDMHTISQSIAHIEAEMESIVMIEDKALLLSQFEQLSNILNDASINTIETKSPLSIRRKASQFQNVAILVNVFSNSEAVKKSFLALHAGLLDLIREAAVDNFSAYPTGRSAIAANEDGVGIAWRFTMKKSVDIKNLEKITNTYLRNLNISDYVKGIDEYRSFFNQDTSVNSALISFYEQTGIQSTREELSELITEESFSNVIDSTIVRFSQLNGKLNGLEWDY